jgi:hypothetical protein
MDSKKQLSDQGKRTGKRNLLTVDFDAGCSAYGNTNSNQNLRLNILISP